MPCSEKACVLPALPGSDLCRHHTLLLGGDHAFASRGCRATVETLADSERKRRQAHAKEAQRPARVRRAHAGPR